MFSIYIGMFTFWRQHQSQQGGILRKYVDYLKTSSGQMYLGTIKQQSNVSFVNS